ncbi:MULTISPECIES: carbohydrate ABC transporter permease [Streptomyces]|uniref:Carbohydrate ABC transporter permease n=1 Tax=Streptomyces drozdowiczii TaxID=202862 RepID=A0ABY6Q164_9ACTN|nr:MULTISPECIES: carbohydrate ABC transporter permease [Streptomyces]MCX0242164.1 carbohydrate ABC transporter permease [Streptomyces drozdowiczii]OKJ68565.1 sugar ABC transporter permease [Streptomyces sp. CB02460]UZK57754.1 carbohydrate ABC transporter permease [Streptomyces drozdowiczii]
MSATTRRPARRFATGSAVRYVLLSLGAVAFLFPFYYMIVGSLRGQTVGDLSAAVPSGLTGDNYAAVNSAISLGRSLLNSGIMTIGVLICTLVFGVLAGYALAQLRFRGKGAVFAALLLVQMIPFQLLTLPLYVLVVRDYGLGDNYLGMILPFAINSTAVFLFRQFFAQMPQSLFEAARIDGASELRILWKIALPMARPAVLTALLLTFIGPWNEFLWPFLVTKNADMQPLAVSLASFLSNLQGTVANPAGALLAGACVLALPAVVLFLLFQRHFTSTDIDSGVKG